MSMTPTRFCRHPRSGFTLIELMVVVVIIGVLAVLAVTTYQRYLKRVRTGEAKSNLGAIKVKEEAYFQEFAQYCDVNDQHPALTNIGADKTAWNPAATSGWRVLGWAPSGMVLFSYDVRAGLPGGAGMPAGKGLDATRAWFLATADGDQDKDSTYSHFELTNMRTSIYSTDDLE